MALEVHQSLVNDGCKEEIIRLREALNKGGMKEIVKDRLLYKTLG